MKAIPFKYRRKIDRIGLHLIVIPLLMFTILFIFLGIFVSSSVERVFYHRLETNSLKLAESYSFTVQKSEEARSVICDFFCHRITIASESFMLYEGDYTNEVLNDLAKTLGVDVIYLYDASQSVKFSSGGEHIGWQAYEGHPVKQFAEGQETFIVESIRPDSESKEPMKFGYVKLQNGWVAQLGIQAETVASVLADFELSAIFSEMVLAQSIEHISYLDENFRVLESTDSNQVNQIKANGKMAQSLANDEQYSQLTMMGNREIYEVYMPIVVSGEKKGVLVVGHCLEDTFEIIKNMNMIGFAIMFFGYLMILYIIILTYNKNRKLRKIAYYDVKTKRPNIYYLKAFLNECLKSKVEPSQHLIFININNIESINRLYGLDHTDTLLTTLANRIGRSFESEKAVLFRMSVSRFALYLGCDQDVKSRLGVLIKLLEESIHLDPISHHLEGQLLVVPLVEKYDSADALFSDALIYLKQMSELSFREYRYLDLELDATLNREKMVEQALLGVLANPNSEQLFMEYQPEIMGSTGQVSCFESLARLWTKELGAVSPVEFIDIAERKQMIDQLGLIILRKACGFIKSLEKIGRPDIKVAVNISGIQFLRDDFVNHVVTTIRETQIRPEQLEIEITESVFMANFMQVNEMLFQLQKIGVSVALDDFGTGYSSFYKLEELKINKVKIDKLFIQKIRVDNSSNLITGDIISMAHKMNLIVTAEGIEDHIQKAYLLAHKCDLLQGYLFGRPVSAEKSLQMVLDWSAQ